MANAATQISCVSKYSLDWNFGGLDKHVCKFAVLPNWHEVSVVPSMEKLSLDAHDMRKLVLLPGRIEPRKGAHILVDAAAEVCAAGYGNIVRFLIVGPTMRSGPKSDYIANLWEMVRAAKLEGSVDIVHQFTNLNDLYESAYLTVQASTEHESFGLTLIESMSHGTPVLASRLGPAPEILSSSNTELLFNVADARELADKIIHLVDAPEDYLKLRESCLAQSMNYSQSKVWPKYHESILNLVEHAADV
jgi:glycosyltransferase involved in cell wall biosynthesis